MSADVRAISKWLNEQTGVVPRGEIAVLIQEHARYREALRRIAAGSARDLEEAMFIADTALYHRLNNLGLG